MKKKKKITVQNVLSWKDVCFSQLKQKTAQCIQKLPHPLSVFPDLSQEHYYGIAVSSRKSIVGIEMQMSKASSPLRCWGSLSPAAPHFWTGGGLTWALLPSHDPWLCTHSPWLCSRQPGLCSLARLRGWKLCQHQEGVEDRRGFQSPHVAIAFLGPEN